MRNGLLKRALLPVIDAIANLDAGTRLGYACVHVCMYVYMYGRVCFVCVCVYVCVCVCVYVLPVDTGRLPCLCSPGPLALRPARVWRNRPGTPNSWQRRNAGTKTVPGLF